MTETDPDRRQDTQGGVDHEAVEIPNRRYFKIGEVCALTGVKPHVLRYWESEFKVLNPTRAGSRQRLYRRVDVLTVLTIKRLLKDEGFTISGAKKVLASGSRRPLETPEGAAKIPALSTPALLAEIKDGLLSIRKILEQ